MSRCRIWVIILLQQLVSIKFDDVSVETSQVLSSGSPFLCSSQLVILCILVFSLTALPALQLNLVPTFMVPILQSPGNFVPFLLSLIFLTRLTLLLPSALTNHLQFPFTHAQLEVLLWILVASSFACPALLPVLSVLDQAQINGLNTLLHLLNLVYVLKDKHTFFLTVLLVQSKIAHIVMKI